MKTRTRSVTTIEVDDIEVELENNPEYFEPITIQPTPNTLVVGYLIYDQDCENPMTSCDCEGKLYTCSPRYGGGSITDDTRAPSYLGLADFGRGRDEPEYDLDIAGIDERIEEMVATRIKADPELTAWMIANVMETEATMDEIIRDNVRDQMESSSYSSLNWHRLDPENTMIHRLGDYSTLATKAWEELYDEGKIGEYLAVPIYYCANNHGPGTTSAHTTSLDNANAVWVPDKCSIENMNFTDCITYADKLKVAEKYADGVLEQYQLWANGDTFGIIVETFRLEGDGYMPAGESDSCWGFIGGEYAERELKDQMAYAAKVLKETEGILDIPNPADYSKYT